MIARMKTAIVLAPLGLLLAGSLPAAPFPVPTIDLAAEKQWQVIVAREAGQYLGHPTIVLSCIVS